jgi:tRNA (guanosine-2'-O-)-methyltransferase
MRYTIPSHLEPHLGSLRALLSAQMTEERLSRFSEVLDGRSRDVVAVFQDTHHSHNISAVLRTCDALGFQDALFVYKDEYRNPRLKDCVERGAASWLSLRRAETIADVVKALKSSGYLVGLVSLPDFRDSAGYYSSNLPSFSNLEISGERFCNFVAGRRIALVFGNEAVGVACDWVCHADFYCHVGMTGFVESLKLSVCAGILLSRYRVVIESRAIFGWSEGLNPDERALLFDCWCAQSLANARRIIAHNHPELKEYYDFVMPGRYFQPFKICG